MQIIDNMIQKIRSVPETVREPMISNKEIEQLTRNLMLVRECEYLKRLEIR